MGTKSNPGKFDCYAEAAPDEPIFVLRANDPLAPIVVRIWALLRSGRGSAYIMRWLNRGRDISSTMGTMSKDKYDEAINCADEMEKWNEEKQRVPVQPKQSEVVEEVPLCGISSVRAGPQTAS